MYSTLAELCNEFSYYTEAVLGNDGCIYTLPRKIKLDSPILKFDPINNSLSQIKDEFMKGLTFCGGLVTTDDGHIYSANEYGQVSEIDITNKKFAVYGIKMYNGYEHGWGKPAIGADNCIYFLPFDYDQVLKFNPVTKSILLVGDSYGHVSFGYDGSYGERGSKWYGAASASNGFIYGVSHCAKAILQVDARHINDQVLELIDDAFANC